MALTLDHQLPISPPRPASTQRGFDLLRLPLVRRLLTSRLFPFVLAMPALWVFVVVILSGFFGTPVGNANLSTVFVWILWWGALIMLLIPFGGRVWCSVCPMGAAGEGVQRRSIAVPGHRTLLTLGLPWPKSLQNVWLQNFTSVGIAGFSAVILTRPAVTSALLLGLGLVALALFLVYRRRVFCRYICPVGGFIGLYSGMAPVGVRAVDADVCLVHCGPNAKECIKGSERGFGCPWMEYPGTLERNSYCGMCTECFKTCPRDNMGLYLRPFGADLAVPTRRLDEAYRSFIMLGSVIAYTALMIGPWGWMKSWANLGSGNPIAFVGFVALLAASTLLVIPGLFFGGSWISKTLAGAKDIPVRSIFIGLAYAAIPLGLAAWIAFSLDFLLANFAYVVQVVSDPLGWGWNLLGTADYAWRPYAPELLPYLQVPILAVGLAASVRASFRMVEETSGAALRSTLAFVPGAALLTCIALLLAWLLVG